MTSIVGLYIRIPVSETQFSIILVFMPTYSLILSRLTSNIIPHLHMSVTLAERGSHVPGGNPVDGMQRYAHIRIADKHVRAMVVFLRPPRPNQIKALVT